MLIIEQQLGAIAANGNGFVQVEIAFRLPITEVQFID
jgi:hypothetical protein